MKRDYNDPVYKRWRISVYKRDDFTCQMPGCKSKRRIQAHHIEKWSSAAAMRFDTNNGITLCQSCHKKITGHENHYKQLFIKIINKKNG